MWGVLSHQHESTLNNFETVNSILDSILHFPLSLYNFPPFPAYFFQSLQMFIINTIYLGQFDPPLYLFCDKSKIFELESSNIPTFLTNTCPWP